MRRTLALVRILLAFIYEYAKELSYSITAIWVLIYCLHPARFASHYSYIRSQDIQYELDNTYDIHNNSCKVIIKDRYSSQLNYPNEHPVEEPSSLARRLGILPGGQWKPSQCQPLFNIAIILPYRNREKQLNIFLNYIHPFLHKQNIEYRIFVIEQSFTKKFNRAKLFNVGFVEANRINDFHCFIFHDIDLIPQNTNNIYACTKIPRHMSSSVNTFRYNLPYTGLFGGAIAITRNQFEKVNGFSNIFYGWGGEDDDFYSRLQNKGLQVTRFGPDTAQYYMLNHDKEPPSKDRYINLRSGKERYDIDGISDLDYKVVNHQLRPLYTWMLVDL